MVDDDPLVRTMLARFFNAADYEIVTASDGLEGMEKAKELLPDIVLVDVAMPNLGGIELCALLKENARTGKIPVLFLSGDDHIAKVEEALKRGGEGYVHKPFNLARLMDKVNQILGPRRPAPEA